MVASPLVGEALNLRSKFKGEGYSAHRAELSPVHSAGIQNRFRWQAPTLQAMDLMDTLVGGPELGLEDLHGRLLGT